jgi:hypothetical protein
MYKVHVLYVSSHLLRRAGTLLNPRNSAAGPMVSQQVIGRSKESTRSRRSYALRSGLRETKVTTYTTGS